MESQLRRDISLLCLNNPPARFLPTGGWRQRQPYLPDRQLVDAARLVDDIQLESMKGNAVGLVYFKAGCEMSDQGFGLVGEIVVTGNDVLGQTLVSLWGCPS